MGDSLCGKIRYTLTAAREMASLFLIASMPYKEASSFMMARGGATTARIYREE